MSAPKFTPDQLLAVDVARRHLDACVVAGPGSGKTTVLVEYFRRLVEAGVDPLRILAITFTEKAAGNMRTKISGAFPEAPEMRAKLERAWISTVHGFCARLLRENAVFAGVDPEFAMADERDSIRLQSECIAAAMEEAFQTDRAGVRAFIRSLAPAEFEDAVVAAYDAMRGAGMTIEQAAAIAPRGPGPAQIAEKLAEIRRDPLRGWEPKHRSHLAEVLESAQRILSANSPRDALRAWEEFPLNLNSLKRGSPARDLAKQLRALLEHFEYQLITELYAPQRQFLVGVLQTFDRLYRQRKRAAGVLDFSDLEEFTVRLLEHSPQVRARLQAQFDHILMDEFQDTNGQQARLLSLIRPIDRFYAVGDINQSIFGFRHAEPQGFAQYRDQVQSTGRRLVNLVDNFRSRAPVLSAVETITANRPGIEERKLTAGREFPRDRATCVEVIAANGESAEEALVTEAKWVARRILELKRDEPFHFKDFAVLLRNTDVLPQFTAAFDEAGIPYLVSRARGFFDNREVADLVHLLRIVANPRDEISLAAVLRSPLVNVSDEAILTLRMLARNLSDGLSQVTLQNQADFGVDDYAKLTRFNSHLHRWRARRDSVTFDRLLLDAIDDVGYRAESGARGDANVEKFLAQARAAAARMTLDEYVDDLAQARKKDPRERDAPLDDAIEAVKIMTAHAAKGLEFPVVFVSAIHKGMRADLEAIEFSPRIGIGARWRNPANGQPKDDLFQHAIREERERRESHESDRLLYVAMTRAEEHLALTFSGQRHTQWDQTVITATHLDPETPTDETVSMRAPDGSEWSLRKLVVDAPPELLRHEAQPAAESAAELLDPAPLTGLHDSNATVTALAQFSRCPNAYYLATYLAAEGRKRNVAAVDDEPKGDIPADEIGSQTHALLAGVAVADPHPEATKLSEVFRKSALGKRLAHATRVEREFDFLMNVEDLVIRGQVDLWFEEGGELVIVDYKTDAVNGVEAHARAHGYELQLRLYAMAVERVAGRPVDRAWLHFLRPDKTIEVDVAPSLLDSPENSVREFLEAQDSLTFPLREAPHCRTCEFFKSLCPSKYPV